MYNVYEVAMNVDKCCFSGANSKQTDEDLGGYLMPSNQLSEI